MLERIIDILPYQISHYPQEDALVFKYYNIWKKYSANECQRIIDDLSAGMLSAGISIGDKVAIISANRPEWNFVDLALLQIGAVTVPLYPNMSDHDYDFIFKQAEVKTVFVGNEELLKKVNRVIVNTPKVKTIFTFDKIENVTFWKDLLSAKNEKYKSKVEKIKSKITSDDLVSIIYTSGTTDEPKGVMLTHKNIISNVLSLSEIMPHNETHKALSFLPLCHIFERTTCYFYLYNGTSIYYAESLETIAKNLKEISPHFFTTVPRLLEKVYEKIYTRGRQLPFPKKNIFFWALNLGLKYDKRGKNSALYNAQLKVARKLVFSKWLDALGGNLIAINSGAAALQPRLAKVFCAAGISIREGYGLTETSPVLTVNRFKENEYCLGSVGMAVPGVDLMLDGNGEILAKGPNIMQGYYKRPDLTEKVIDKDGWFHTGDVGELVDGKFLKITDRLKELFKTSGGKYIAPQQLENKLKESIFIEQVIIIGENKKHPAALIVPKFTLVEKWCHEKGITVNSKEDIANSLEVHIRIFQDIQRFNLEFEHSMQIKKIKILPEEWSIDSGELTATLKLKRKFIINKYQTLIDEIYSDDSKINL